jgi:hypothetical protein
MSPRSAARVTYKDMWLDACDRAGAADDMLREFARMDDALDPVEDDRRALYEKKLAIAKGQANLVAWCERNQDHVKASLAKEAADQAARELAAANSEGAGA